MTSMAMPGDPEAGRIARAVDVVWRFGPDRVLLQRVGGPREVAAVDLIGDVAFTWIALDAPATRNQLATRLVEAGIDVADLDADVDYLLDHQLVTRTVDDGATP